MSLLQVITAGCETQGAVCQALWFQGSRDSRPPCQDQAWWLCVINGGTQRTAMLCWASLMILWLADKLKLSLLCTCLQITLLWAHLEEKWIPPQKATRVSCPTNEPATLSDPSENSHPCQQSWGLPATSKHQDLAAKSREGTKLYLATFLMSKILWLLPGPSETSY